MDYNTFTLEIALGNELMQTPQDVAAALQEYAQHLENACDWGDSRQAIMDLNGNRVGTGYAEAV